MDINLSDLWNESLKKSMDMYGIGDNSLIGNILHAINQILTSMVFSG